MSTKGGLARAKRLTSVRRSEIARQAASARWGTNIHVATHRGAIKIGDNLIECAVLEDGTRLLSQGTVLSALGRNPDKSRRSRADGELRAPFLAADNLQPFISEELKGLAEPIPYRVAGELGARNWGYRAEMFPMVCDVYLEARASGALVATQKQTARAAEILMRALAKVGITALIDEATGYQDVRRRDELQRLLETYVQAEFRPWIKTFPDEFFAEIYRLQGWDRRPGTKRPGFVGTLINKYIYDQLPPGVADELRKLNPRNANGNRVRKHHQFLTEGTGNVHLDRQISTVTTLLRISTNKREFEELFQRAFPPAQDRLPLEIAVEPGEESESA